MDVFCMRGQLREGERELGTPVTPRPKARQDAMEVFRVRGEHGDFGASPRQRRPAGPKRFLVLYYSTVQELGRGGWGALAWVCLGGTQRSS